MEPVTLPAIDQPTSHGWINDPHAVNAVLDRWASQNIPITLAEAAPKLYAAGDSDEPVFFWDAEQMVLGKILPPWDQNPVGSCVGFGSTGSGQDLLVWEIASEGDLEEWPGAELAPEVTYAGSRVEIGGGQIRGDGSVGAWASDWLTRYGVVKRGVYGNLDLTSYSPSLCRQLGNRGVPSDVETLARQHQISASALVTTKEEGWSAIGGGKPVFVCSNQGFTMTLDKDGFAAPYGRWDHCMRTRGRFRHPRKGRSVIMGNSWADYLNSLGREVEYVKADGSTGTFKLPGGCFCTTWDVWGGMLSQRDSFALAGLSGWKRTKPVSYRP
jgi:hypothetical protein